MDPQEQMARAKALRQRGQKALVPQEDFSFAPVPIEAELPPLPPTQAAPPDGGMHAPELVPEYDPNGVTPKEMERWSRGYQAVAQSPIEELLGSASYWSPESQKQRAMEYAERERLMAGALGRGR